MNCEFCDNEIPQERLEVLPDTTTCVKCSKVRKNVCYPVFAHKTAPETVIIGAESGEEIRRARRANNRSR
jgi:hypothetical protein